MSKVGTLGAAGLTLAWFAAGAAAAQEVEARYTEVGAQACQVADIGEPLGQDWLLYRCEGDQGVAVWLLYQDSARLQVAFGPDDFEDYRPWSFEREPEWPVEWRGRRGSPPFAAIIRMTPLTDASEQAAPVLAVFRVWPDRPDCYLGAAADNDAARRLADAAESLTACPAD